MDIISIDNLDPIISNCDHGNQLRSTDYVLYIDIISVNK